MSSDIATIDAERHGLDTTRLQQLETPALRAELARALTVTAESVAYLAAVWRELEGRGEDLSDLRTGLGSYLPLIAAGQLDPEAVVRFAGQRTLLRSVATLPIAEQRRLARGGPIRILTIDPSGEFATRELPATQLTASMARLVFDEGRLRTADEQRAILDSAKIATRRREMAPRRVGLDPRSGQLRIGRTRVPVGEVMAALAAAVPEVEDIAADDEGAKMIPVRLTAEEHQALKIRAAEGGLSLQRLVRVALANAGLLSRG